MRPASASGQAQVQESAHMVDLCVDYVGRDGVGDISILAGRFATDVAAPVVLDSTEPEVLEAGLERLGGRSVLNSANLEDGFAPGSGSTGCSHWPASMGRPSSAC